MPEPNYFTRWVLRATWRSYYEKKGDSVSCPSHLCGSEVDSLDHAKVCKFLETKFDERKMSHPKEFSKYLVRLNQERFYGDCGLSNWAAILDLSICKLNARSNISIYLSEFDRWKVNVWNDLPRQLSKLSKDLMESEVHRSKGWQTKPPTILSKLDQSLLAQV